MSPSEYTSVSFRKESNKLVGTTTCPKSNGLDAKNMDATKGIVLNLRRTTTTREKREEARVTQEVKEDDKKQKKEDPLMTKSTSLLKVFFQRG